MNRRAVCVIVATLLSGCSALSDKWTVLTEDGAVRGPAPIRYEASIKAYFDETLKDPFSAVIRNTSAPVEEILTTRTVLKSPTLVNVNGTLKEVVDHVWLVKTELNAKNSYGAYVGWQSYEFAFSGERIVNALNRTAETEAAKRALDAFIRY